MNRIRKTLAWLWRIKERIILATVVVILCHRVYKIFNPDTPADANTVSYQIPRAKPPEGVFPEAPPPPPPPPRPIDVARLYRQNMMIHTPGGGGPGDTGESVDVKALRIAQGRGGEYRAQLQTGRGANTWVSEGDKFEAYEVISIDPTGGPDQEGSVKIYVYADQEFYDIPIE